MESTLRFLFFLRRLRIGEGLHLEFSVPFFDLFVEGRLELDAQGLQFPCLPFLEFLYSQLLLFFEFLHPSHPLRGFKLPQGVFDRFSLPVVPGLDQIGEIVSLLQDV